MFLGLLLLIMEQITEHLANKFHLRADEEAPVAPRVPNRRREIPGYLLSLIGRVIIDRELSLTFIRANVLRLLNPFKGAEIKYLAHNLFLITFNHALDRKKVLEGWPWVLDKHALLHMEVDPNVTLKEHRPHIMKVIIRVHDLPSIYHSEETAELIGEKFGEYRGLATMGSAASLDCLRIKVAVDVDNPLKRGLFLLNDDLDKIWYKVTYERLPMFCFLCGILGHGEANCPTRYEENFVEPTEGLPYGKWMRATGEGAGGERLPLQTLPSNSTLLARSSGQGKKGGDIFSPQAAFGGQKENNAGYLNLMVAERNQWENSMDTGAS